MGAQQLRRVVSERPAFLPDNQDPQPALPEDRANRKYGLMQEAINRTPQGDALQRAATVRDEFGDPTAAQFPVSAATNTPLYNSGYGAGYNKSPLDPGYQAPVRTVALPLPSSNEATVAPIERRTAPIALPLESMKPPPTMIQRNNKGRPVAIVGGGDRIAANQELIRAQEDYKAPRSTKDQLLALAMGGIPGAVGYATNQDVRNRWAVGDDIASEENQINRDLGVQGKQAGIAAAKQRPIYQQAQLDSRNAQQDEREVNDALQRYKDLDHYDETDPSYASLRDYFRSHGLVGLPKKDSKGSNVNAIWADGHYVLVDKTNAQQRDTGATDISRTPNAQGLNPNQQATVNTANANRTSREAEGQKNREARAAITNQIIEAVAGRQDKQIAASIAQLGDPQEMYGAASDLWSQAQSKEQQANSMQIATTADAETKKQLLNEAVKLKDATIKIQQEARKASSAGRGRSAGMSAPDTRKGTITKAQQDRWLADNPGKALSDMQALYPNAVMVK